MRVARTTLLTVSIALAGQLGVIPPVMAVVGDCEVHNVTQDVFFGPDAGAALTNALDRAESGDTLELAGTCAGGYLIPRRLSVTILGVPGRPYPVINGSGFSHSLEIPTNSALLLRRVTFSGDPLLAIFTRGDVQLRHVKIVDIRTFFSVIRNAGSGDLLITHSKVTGTTMVPEGFGGAVVNMQNANLLVKHSRVIRNIFDDLAYGGITNLNGGKARVIESVVRHNKPYNCRGVDCKPN